MYERFYNLRERPFSLTPDPDYLYPSRFHRETLNYLRYGIEGHAGFVVITGEIGSGKTTLLQTALRGLDRRTSVARLINTNLDARELLEAVMLDFGLEPVPGQSKPYLLRQLAGFLVAQRNADRLTLLVIDEAQNLSPDALEEIRMLSNIETEKSKLLQVVLVGQPGLRALLTAPQLEQLRQRVTVSYHLLPLDNEETHAYVNHRIRRASLGAPLDCPPEVSSLLHHYSGGIPRTINVIADAVLLFGYADDRHELTPGLAREVIDELLSTGVIGEPRVLAPSPQAASSRVAAPGPTSAAPALQASDAERQLLAREARIEQRERELAEQRRVLNESLRLLRVQQSALAGRSTPAPGGPAAASDSPARAIDNAHAEPVQPPLAAIRSTAARRPMRFQPTPPASGLWARLRRTMLGVGHPTALED